MSSKTVRYKCPFCEKRLTREDLIIHINDEHEDLLPQNYSATRYVFNYVNRKPVDYCGKCTECGSPTKWREDVARYARQCDRPACKESYLKKFEDNMIRMRGVSRISSTPEGQEKMLANRKISGTYKFQNGKEKTYTGSYELNTLKFMDQVMNINPDDIMCPGPVLEYEYKGQRHFYITDFYYIPYNLIIEVKDGGKNPNRRNMPEYREKQIAKEKYIIKNTDYAYLRLTDNDLSQLLSVFMDLKMQLKDNTGKRTVHVNESMCLLKENFLFSEDNLEYNMEKIDNGESNIIFITGHSGGGKTTTMGILKDKYRNKKVETISIDLLYVLILATNANRLDKVEKYRKNKNACSLLIDYFDSLKFDSDISDFNDPRLVMYFEKFLLFLESERCKSKYNNTIFIVEGTQIFMINNLDFYKDKPVIIIGTSVVKGYIRKAKRDIFSEEQYKDWNKVKQLFTMIPIYFKYEKRINDLKNVLDESVIYESNDKSKLDKNFKKKETDIKFTYIDIKNNKSKVDKYLANDKDYKNTYKKSIDEIDGEIVIDEDDELAGYVFVINNFITPLFVVKKYRGYGLGETLLKDAIKKYGAKRLWVYKDNEVSINLYKKYGFKVYIEDDEPSILMALDRKYAENLGYDLTESVIYEGHLLNEPDIYYNKDKFDSVNEAMDALMTGYIPGFDSASSVYIVNYMKNNVFSGDEERGYGVSNNPKLTNMFSRDKEGKLVKFPDNFLEECRYDVYMVNLSPEEVSNRIGKYIGEFVEEGFLYESIFGKKMYTYDQIMLEESAIPVIDYYKGLEMFSEVTRNLILQNVKLDNNPIYFNENSNMVFDIGNEKDLACVSYTSLRDGKYYVESVEYPELYLESDSINSVEAKFLQLLSSYRKEVK